MKKAQAQFDDMKKSYISMFEQWKNDGKIEAKALQKNLKLEFKIQKLNVLKIYLH